MSKTKATKHARVTGRNGRSFGQPSKVITFYLNSDVGLVDIPVSDSIYVHASHTLLKANTEQQQGMNTTLWYLLKATYRAAYRAGQISVGAVESQAVETAVRAEEGSK